MVFCFSKILQRNPIVVMKNSLAQLSHMTNTPRTFYYGSEFACQQKLKSADYNHKLSCSVANFGGRTEAFGFRKNVSFASKISVVLERLKESIWDYFKDIE